MFMQKSLLSLTPSCKYHSKVSVAALLQVGSECRPFVPGTL